MRSGTTGVVATTCLVCATNGVAQGDAWHARGVADDLASEREAAAWIALA